MNKINKGTLYLVPTPIGNINDISKRSIEILQEVFYIACEDTRNTNHLLSLLNIKNNTYSCHEHNEISASKKIINDLLNGYNIAYCSDAGAPCISDPGFILVQEAIKNDIKIVPLPGSNAALTALIASGIDTTHFYFYGFLDTRYNKKIEILKKLENIEDTLIFYESPNRINDTIKALYEIYGERKIVIARELTKIYEEFIRSDLKTLNEQELNIKGEIVIILEGNKNKDNSNDLKIYEEKIKLLIESGFSKSDSVLIVSKLFNINKNKLYKLIIND